MRIRLRSTLFLALFLLMPAPAQASETGCVAAQRRIVGLTLDACVRAKDDPSLLGMIDSQLDSFDGCPEVEPGHLALGVRAALSYAKKGEVGECQLLAGALID